MFSSKLIKKKIVKKLKTNNLLINYGKGLYF